MVLVFVGPMGPVLSFETLIWVSVLDSVYFHVYFCFDACAICFFLPSLFFLHGLWQLHAQQRVLHVLVFLVVLYIYIYSLSIFIVVQFSKRHVRHSHA